MPFCLEFYGRGGHPCKRGFGPWSMCGLSADRYWGSEGTRELPPSPRGACPCFLCMSWPACGAHCTQSSPGFGMRDGCLTLARTRHFLWFFFFCNSCPASSLNFVCLQVISWAFGEASIVSVRLDSRRRPTPCVALAATE